MTGDVIMRGPASWRTLPVVSLRWIDEELVDKGARVVTDVIPGVRGKEAFPGLIDSENGSDVVVIAVPRGEGVAVEAAIRRALRVEST